MKKHHKTICMIVAIVFAFRAHSQDTIFSNRHNDSISIGSITNSNQDANLILSDKFRNNLNHLSVRLSYEYGPEVILLLFPPMKLGVDYNFFKHQYIYIGMDGSINGLVAFWSQIGMYAGCRFKVFTLESRINKAFMEAPDGPTSQYLSFNPKIGFEIESFYLKVGPYLPIKHYGARDLNTHIYPKINNTMLNIEVGYCYYLKKILDNN